MRTKSGYNLAGLEWSWLFASCSTMREGPYTFSEKNTVFPKTLSSLGCRADADLDNLTTPVDAKKPKTDFPEIAPPWVSSLFAANAADIRTNFESQFHSFKTQLGQDITAVTNVCNEIKNDMGKVKSEIFTV